MTKLTSQAGVSLIDLVISLAIGAVIIVPLASILAFELRVPIKTRSELTASQQIQKATLLLTEDASTAQSFTAGVGLDYGTFSWFEFSGVSVIPVTARYFWALDADHPKGYGNVLRELTRDGEVTPPQIVMEGVATSTDLTLQHVASKWIYTPATKLWSYTEGKIDITATTTHEAGLGFGGEAPETVFSASLVSDLRPQTLLPAPLPSRLPPPPPAPNQIDFLIDGEPSVIKGTVKSGSGAGLSFDDSNHYVVSSQGSPRTVTWEATSESVDYTEITSGIIQFTSQSSKACTSLEIFVFNSDDPAHTDGGYDTSPDLAST